MTDATGQRPVRQSRAPVQPDLGISVTPVGGAAGANPLVTLGDSLTHGFKSLAICDTKLSWPKMVADACGIADFRIPTYAGPEICPGLPLNLEAVLRRVEEVAGDAPLPAHTFALGRALHRLMDQVEDYWERGDGTLRPESDEFPHNLAIYGWDLRDALSKSVGWCQKNIADHPASDDLLNQLVENNGELAALRVLNIESASADTTMISAAETLAEDGIDTLVVLLGSNNALPSILRLKLEYSKDPEYRDLTAKNDFTVWRTEHFLAEFDELMSRVDALGAKRVIWGTVPHVTVAPLLRGVGDKPLGSRYFTRYTRAWISDGDFDPHADHCLTGDQAREIDDNIDGYCEGIVERVREARNRGKDWYVFDLGGLLDRLAYRRYLSDPTARPDWFTPYELPPELNALYPRPDTRFFNSDELGRLQGGLIALDGVHPTTIGYGLMAREMLTVLKKAGVERAQNASIDFAKLIQEDTLISNPPRSLAHDLRTLAWLDQTVDLFSSLIGRRSPI